MSTKKYVPGTRIIDLTDQRFGALVAKSWFRRDGDARITWRCIGDCGHSTNVSGSVLRSGETKSCGRYGCIVVPHIDLVGQCFGRLTAISFVSGCAGNPGKWECECSCGAGKTVLRATNELQSRAEEGVVQSCGCFLQEFNKAKRLPDEVVAFNNVHREYTRSALQRGLVFELPRTVFDDLLRGDCHYCGVPPLSNIKKIQNRLGSTSVGVAYNGIDRKDPSIGYTVDNCVSCCFPDNRGKGDIPYDDYIAWSNRKIDFIQGQGGKK